MIVIDLTQKGMQRKAKALSFPVADSNGIPTMKANLEDLTQPGKRGTEVELKRVDGQWVIPKVTRRKKASSTKKA